MKLDAQQTKLGKMLPLIFHDYSRSIIIIGKQRIHHLIKNEKRKNITKFQLLIVSRCTYLFKLSK